MCVLKWYIKSLYRHLFLEDISEHARVTQKMALLICGSPNCQAPWLTRPKIGLRVAKALSCDIVVFYFFPVNPPPPPPPPWVIVLRRGGTKKNRAIFLVPPLLNTITLGGFTGKKTKKPTISQLRALATRTPILGWGGQGAWHYDCHKLGSAIFLVTLAFLDISSKKRCLYRLFIYQFKAYTISNKLV